MSSRAPLVLVLLLTTFLLASSLATTQGLVASGIGGGGTTLERAGRERHAVSVGQTGAGRALVDSNERPRLVGGIGGVLAAQSVPEPGAAAAKA